ncbi:MAG: flagellar hook-associated protein FlgK, partial [Chloroflexota bacterium]|nr:flagellar hook-associated protein FlgK [Chloroflexota bacterium]
MTSPFFGLDIAARALRANQTLVDITNQNVANASTPGFSRQSAVIKETPPYPIPVFRQGGQPGQLGTGVQVTDVTRTRDAFTDYQYRAQVAAQGRWTARQSALQQIEAIVNEPSNSGISTVLSKYWSAWQELASSPSDVSVRANLLQQGKAVADAFQYTVKLFGEQQRDMDMQIRLSVADINNYAEQIARLNVQIANVETSGLRANDLRDQRDLLLDKLSGLIKVSAVESSEGSLSLYIGGRQLVDRDRVNELGLDATSGPFARVIWSDANSTSAIVADGKLAGLLESRDTILADRIRNIDDLAGRIIDSVNSVHAGGVGLDGVGGLAFFTGTDARSMAVDPTLTVNRVAAARPYPDPNSATNPPSYLHAVGDGSNAVALAQLQGRLAQRGTTGLAPGSSAGTAAVLAVDVASARVNASFSFTYNGGALTISDGSTSQVANVTIASDQPDGTPATRRVVTVDGGPMGVRLTLSVPASGSVAADLATALSGLDGQSVSSRGPSTVGEQYGQEVAAIGVLSASARGQAENQAVLVNHLERHRQEVSGVSLDEEA